MSSSKSFRLICLVISCAIVSPVPLVNNILDDFLRNDPNKNNVIVKRQISDNNTDRQLKEISLSSLVGDLEKNILTSALSLNKVLTDKNFTVADIKAINASHDDVNKSRSLTIEENNNKTSTIIATTTDTVILQTAEKVEETIDAPAHIVIDRIAIQPHTGGVALLPAFQLNQTVRDEYAKKDTDTKTTVSKTEITTSATETAASESESSNSSSSTSTTPMTDEFSTTTPPNLEQLKEAEEELKEKFAEIEAEPIILSARV